MRPHIVARYIGLVLLSTAIFMLLSAGISFIYNDTALYPLLLAGIITGAVGLFPMIFVPFEMEINTREGYIIITLSWLFGCLFGMLPYILWGGSFSVSNAWFESVSGFTTTGATILSDIEKIPPGLLFWRSSTHWLGGVGVVVFTLIILPSIGSARMRLSRVEFSRLAQHEDAKYTSQQIVRIILKVYVGLTLATFVSLIIAGMSVFDAINHAFSTVATGGFSTKNLSIMYYDSPAIEIILIVFMVLSSINFGILYVSILKKFKPFFNSPIIRYFLISLLVGILLIALNIRLTGLVGSFPAALRQAAFQLVSLATTTGYAGCDTSIWPNFAMLVALFFMVQCGCSGSTSGGVKVDRVLIFYKTFIAKIRKTLHPNAVVPIKLKGIILDDEVVASTNLFIVLYIMIVFASTLLLSFTGVGLEESVTGAIASMANVGPGFGGIASLDNYGALPWSAKIICTFTMIIGRLEIFGFLMIFYYRYWK